MTIEDRKKKLQFAEQKAIEAQRKVRRASTSLKFWERRKAMHFRALAAETEAAKVAEIADNERAIWTNTPRGRKFRD